MQVRRYHEVQVPGLSSSPGFMIPLSKLYELQTVRAVAEHLGMQELRGVSRAESHFCHAEETVLSPEPEASSPWAKPLKPLTLGNSEVVFERFTWLVVIFA